MSEQQQLTFVFDCSTLNCAARFLCPGVVLLEETTGNSVSFLRLWLNQFQQLETEDLIVLLPKDESAEELKRLIAEKVKKMSKRLRNLRIQYVTVPLQPSTPALGPTGDLIRLLAQQLGALLSKPFVYFNGICLPPKNLAAMCKKFRTLAETKDASLLIYSKTQRGPKPGIPRDSIPAGHLIMTDKKTRELVGLKMWSHEETFIFDDFCRDNKSVCQYTEGSALLENKSELTFNLWFANGKLLESFQLNHDFQNLGDYITNALSQPCLIDGIYVEPMEAGKNTYNGILVTLKQFQQMLALDSQLANDCIEFAGNKSYWRRVPVRSLRHENADECEEGREILGSVLFERTKLGKGVKSVKWCIVGPHVELQGETYEHSIIIAPGKTINESITEPSIILSEISLATAQKLVELQPHDFICAEMWNGLVRLKTTESWWKENLSDDTYSPKLLKDPTKDVNVFWDSLFDLQEAKSEPSEDEQAALDSFREEVQDLLDSGVDGHMADLIIELRTLRLSENRKDQDLMYCLGAHCAQVHQKRCDQLWSSADVKNFLVEHQIVDLVKAFNYGEHETFAFYDGVAEHVTTEQRFIVIISALNEYLKNHDMLSKYVERSSQPVAKSELVKTYIEWLHESSDDSDDSDDSEEDEDDNESSV